jgi:acetyl-CoA C-acetyltransferase
MHEAYVFDGIRTPFGRYGGALATIRPDDLLALNIKEILARNPVPSEKVEDVIMGCTNQAGEDARNIARNAALMAGVPPSVAGITVNRLCGSGLAAALDAARAIRLGEGEIFLAGGVESMTRAPFVLAKTESAFARAATISDTTIGWRFPNPDLLGVIGDDSLFDTAENLVGEFEITRAACDEYAYCSQQKYESARNAGFFADEIFSVTVPGKGRKDAPVTVSADEHPRPDSTPEKLAALKPLRRGGVVTAGNASGINDGAGVLLMGSKRAADQYGLKPRVRILAGAVAGVEPRVMGLGPVPAIRKVLARVGLGLEEMDVIEINEAFAPQVLACAIQLSLEAGDHRLNPNGSAIAVGHPLGASGARLLLTAIRELERRRGRFALVSLCIGIGQGIAAVIERIP